MRPVFLLMEGLGDHAFGRARFAPEILSLFQGEPGIEIHDIHLCQFFVGITRLFGSALIGINNVPVFTVNVDGVRGIIDGKA